jgi:N-acetyl sugar amidotransferase
MDTSDQDIIFNENGFCNHCLSYFSNKSKNVFQDTNRIDNFVKIIKETGKSKKYDCIIGLSGGVDSTYVAFLVKQLGLRPLAVHFDSGWNSEIAVSNIYNIVKNLDIDLYTHVCDWTEMKDIQLAYFKAGVINADIPMDHAFIVVLQRLARKLNIKYFISGHNYETEAILPRSWVYKSTDGRNLLDIQKTHGSIKHLKKYPYSNIIENLYTRFIFGLNTINILNYVHYNKEGAINIITKELGWQKYGGKHSESIFTRFFQGYYLPTRFGVDKRRAHLSTLICSGQLKREEAIIELNHPSYDNEKLLIQDLDFVPKKLGINLKDFQDIITQPIKSHYDYKNDQPIRKFITSIGKFILRKNIEL